MHSNKENQEISVMGRLVSLEALVFLMGVISLIYGIVTLNLTNFVIGALIVVVAAMVTRWLRHSNKSSAK